MQIALLGDSIFHLHFLYFYCENHLKEKRNIKFDVFIFENNSSCIHTVKENDYTIELASPYIHTYKEFFENIVNTINFKNQTIFSNSSQYNKAMLKENFFLKAPTCLNDMSSHKALWLGEKIKLQSRMKQKLSVLPKNSIFQVYQNIGGKSYAEYYASTYARENFYTEAEDCSFALAFPNELSFIKEGNSFLKSIEESKREELQNLDIIHLKKRISKFEKSYINFNGGLKEYKNAILEYLKKNYNEYITFRKENIHSILYKNQQYKIHTKQSKNNHYTHLLCTINPNFGKNIFREMEKPISYAINSIQSKKVTIALLIFNKKQFQQKGYGLLIPRKEEQTFFSNIFISNIFPQMYPKEYFAIRTHIPEDNGLFSEEDILRILLENYKRLFSIKEEPIFYKIYKYSIPIYNQKHYEIIEELKQKSNKYSNLLFNGKYYNQFSISDSIHHAYKLAKNFS